MNCSDVDDALMAIGDSAPAKLPLDADEHMKVCMRCRDLLAALNIAAVSNSPSAATLTRIQQGIVADLRPVRPMAPRRYLFVAFSGMFVLTVAIGVYWLGAFAIAVMSPFQTVAVLGALTACSALMAWSLVGQMVPGSRQRVSPVLLPAFIVFVLTLVMAVLFQVQNERNFWVNSWICIKSGTSIGLLATIPAWLLLRRGAVLSPRVTGGAAGLLAGLAGTTTLELHCPNLDVWHILASHLGVAVLGALVGFIAGMVVESFSRRSFHSRHNAVA